MRDWAPKKPLSLRAIPVQLLLCVSLRRRVDYVRGDSIVESGRGMSRPHASPVGEGSVSFSESRGRRCVKRRSKSLLSLLLVFRVLGCSLEGSVSPTYRQRLSLTLRAPQLPLQHHLVLPSPLSLDIFRRARDDPLDLVYVADLDVDCLHHQTQEFIAVLQ